MRIVAARKNQFGVGHYRITHPMIALQRRGHDISIIQVEREMRLCNQWLAADVLILQQQFDAHWFDLVNALPQESYLEMGTGIKGNLRPKIVMEIDDLIWKRNPNSDRDKVRDKDIKASMDKCIPQVDAIITSTPELAAELGIYRKPTYVVPNAIDYDIRDWETKFTSSETWGQLVIGYTGAMHHKGDDVLPFRNALLDTLAEHPDCCFVIPEGLGGEWDWTPNHPQIIGLEGVPFHAFPQLVSLIDIGVAPLLDHPFNRCKSELKLMEYGAWGIPYVASRIAPYERFHELSRAEGGYLCRTYTEWRAAFKILIEGKRLRERMGERIKQFTKVYYNLNTIALEYEEVLYSVLGREVPKCAIN